MRKANGMIKKCILIFLSLIIFSLPCKADEIKDELLSSIDGELSDFYSSLPLNIQEYLKNINEDKSFENLITQFDEKGLLDFVISYATSGLQEVLKCFSSILILIIVIAVFNSLRNSFQGADTNFAFSVCSSLCVTLTVFNVCSVLASNVTTYLNILCNVMTAFAPVMATMMIMSGNVTGAAITNGSMLLFISVIEEIIVVFLLPLTKICIAFSCIKSIGGCDFSGISKAVKNTFTSIIVFTMSVFMFVFSYKSILAQGQDSLSLKTARFAISSFVPIVGSSINEALRAVTSSISILKSSSGIAAIIVIALLMLPIIINLFLHKISFNILATITKIIGAENQSSSLEEADSICAFFLTLVSCTCVLFIISVTVFIKSNVGIVQ